MTMMLQTCPHATTQSSPGQHPLTRREVSILSPLRYPGSKRRLASYISAVLSENDLRPALFVEPFAGGASVSLQLLNDGLVDSVALGERDPLLASFWRIVFRDAEWLIEAVAEVPRTLEQWDYFRSTPLDSDRERALACLFLNRTSFSGILSRRAGPIGGRRQASSYKIDCRFPVQTLAKRIRQAAALAPRIAFVAEADWTETLQRVGVLGENAARTFYYFDPPFYEKAERLYRHYFREADHHALHAAVLELESPWLLSYDPAAPIISLYAGNGHHPTHVEILYSLSASGSVVKAQEVIMTNTPVLPKATRLWRTSEEWREIRPPTNPILEEDR